MIILLKSTRNGGELLSNTHMEWSEEPEGPSQYSSECEVPREAWYCLSWARGHGDPFYAVVQTTGPVLSAWLKRNGDTYLSPEIQNEMLEVMLLSILQSNRQEAAVVQCIFHHGRWVDRHVKPWATVNLFPVGWHWPWSLWGVCWALPDTWHLYWHYCASSERVPGLDKHQWNWWRRQRYDSATNMAGHRNGVATQIFARSPEHFTCIVYT